MLFLMGLLHKTLRVVVILLVLTVVGQIPVKGVSLENRYHRLVNSRNFQKAYWTILTPVTWTGDKIAQLFERPEGLSSQTR